MGDEMVRDYPFEFTRSDGDGLTLEGYAAVFDSPTEINSTFEGKFTETVARGAFKKSVSERTPVLMFNHGEHPLIGDMPIGIINHAREDEHGLFVRARLANNWLVEPVRESIANRSVKGMSFRFEPIRDEWSKKRDRRTLLELRVAELGPVVFPAYEDTMVGVRSSEAIRLLTDPTLHEDLARALLREGSFPNAVVATTIRAATNQPYGNVKYADPGYQQDNKKRYPLDTEEHAKAAWSYINQAKNAALYSSDQLRIIKGRIVSALKKFGVDVTAQSGANQALQVGAVREDTSAAEPLRTDQKPAAATSGSSKRERLLALAYQKGILSGNQ